MSSEDTLSLEGLRAHEAENSSLNDDGEVVEPLQLDPRDIGDEEIKLSLKPRQSNEFTCSECFLVQNKSRISHVEPDGSMICQDCD
ncbi:DUF4193 family protein [Corynebacterium poyangense]|uniref:DUF4193 family protein n=1 Tax=Corynebacterium poyangense TaxID=2684405 RepID=A0A7H0SP79_9CORY|nr:DUF4193 family protein [Corynebacterium poyangense]MBZ8177926.1 DUF4193 family protein [Corynebacterium poyangense]QNQ90354.1 DUF4193 family protein [Corynebacterium poyangense]